MLVLVCAAQWMVAGAAFGQSAPKCPLQQQAGRIVWIDPPSESVSIRRGEETLNVKLGGDVKPCLLFGDHVSAGNAIVDLDMAKGLVKIGRYQDSAEYDVPARQPVEVDRGILARAQSAIKRFFENDKFAQRGVARGAEVECGKSPAVSDRPRSLTALKRLSVGEQLVGSDLPRIVIAWNRNIGLEEVHLQVSDAAGRLVEERRVCGGGQLALTIPPGLRARGSTLVVTASHPRSSPLVWTLRFIEPSGLPVPTAGPTPSWMVGAWLFDEGRKEFQVDALSRLATGADEFLGASVLMSAVLSNAE